jgi:hypothetical protein
MFEDLDYIMKLFDDEDREIQICAAMILGNLARNGTLQFLSLSLSLSIHSSCLTITPEISPYRTHNIFLYE